MNLQKSFRQALPKLFSYKFTWVSRHKLLRDCCNFVRSFKISLGRQSKHYCVLAIVNTIINIHALSVIAQVACTRQA